MQTIRSILRQVPDPRGKKGRQHPLEALLGLMLLSVLCGRKGMMAAFRLGRSLTSKQLQRLGFRRGRPAPCHSTLTELLRILDANAMARVFSQFIAATDEGAATFQLMARPCVPVRTMRAMQNMCCPLFVRHSDSVRAMSRLAAKARKSRMRCGSSTVWTLRARLSRGMQFSARNQSHPGLSTKVATMS